MPTLSVPVTAAKQGVRAATNQLTKIEVRMASVELLVGGPYGDHPYGHTALRVTTRDLDNVYDYGRYGRTWGVAKSEGEGVLNIWNNFNAYIAEENSYGRTTTGFVYETSEEKVVELIAFYEQKLAGKQVKSVTKAKKSVIIDDYFALGPNCTTLSVAAAKKIFPDIDREWHSFQKGRGLGMMEKGLVSANGWPNFIFMPGDLQAMLESSAAKKTKTINRYGGKK